MPAVDLGFHQTIKGMTIPFWCLFIAVVLPYVWFSLAAPLRALQLGKANDNHIPRSQEPLLKDRAARAHGVHLNSLEALTYFGPAVIVAHLCHADATWSARLAVLFIAFRLVHGAMYVADRPPLRTTFFALALFTSFALFILAARA
jgi:uncharacterized MAPEG superfamily protein